MTTNTCATLISDHSPILKHYTLLDIPGVELGNQCEGWGCADGCADCAPRCPFCGAPIHARMCQPQRAAMADDASDVAATLDRLSALIDTHGTVESLREQLATARELIENLYEVAGWYGTLYRDVMKVTPSYFDKCADVDAAHYLFRESDAARDAARAWLRREAR